MAKLRIKLPKNHLAFGQLWVVGVNSRSKFSSQAHPDPPPTSQLVIQSMFKRCLTERTVAVAQRLSTSERQTGKIQPLCVPLNAPIREYLGSGCSTVVEHTPAEQNY